MPRAVVLRELERHAPGARPALDRPHQALLARLCDERITHAQAAQPLRRDGQVLHPATARFIATKLARHFVADDPPPDLVARLADAWQRSSADLPTVYRELIRSPEAWSPQPVKLKTPEELVLAAARVLQFAGTGMAGAASGFGKQAPDFSGIGASIAGLGQRVQAAPSPAGWSDRAEDWLGPDAVWKRIEWSTRLADRFRSSVDARALAAQSLGPLLSDATRTQIERAADVDGA
jgi:uncharacterized protein (DUF1800 family)